MFAQLDGVWHTGIVYRGVEYYFGAGIQSAPAGATPFGKPLKAVTLGKTQVPVGVFQEYLAELKTVWIPEAYSLFENNCNNFCDEVSNFLTGSGIPSYILELPREVLSTAFGQMMAPGLRNMQGTLNSVQQPSTPAQQTPFKAQNKDITSAVTDSLRAATAAVVADTGFPLDADSSRKLAPQFKDDSMKKLAETNVALADDPHAAAEVASSLGRTSIGREHREQLGTSVASTVGFPAPISRRLTTARSGEIITRLGSGQMMSLQPSPRLKLDPKLLEGRRLPPSSASVLGPKEPKDGTKAQPGPSSAKIAGLNAGVAYTLERSNSGRTASAKAAFEAAVRIEFNKIMAEGGCSPNEAAAQAIRRAASVSPSAA